MKSISERLAELDEETIKIIIDQERDKNPLFNKIKLSYEVATRIVNELKKAIPQDGLQI